MPGIQSTTDFVSSIFNVYPKYLNYYNCDHLFINISEIIDTVSSLCNNDEDVFFSKLFTSLNKILETILPVKTVFFLVDGPAPFAKLHIERGYRRGLGRKEKENDIKHRLIPGCSFMGKVDRALSYFASQYIASNKDTKVFVSGSNVPGEADIKILRYIKKIKNQNETFVIYNNFSITQFLIALASGINRLVLCVPQNKFLFMNNIYKYFSNLGFKNQENVVNDFIAISLLLGNNYIPKYSSTIEPIWKHYIHNKEKIESSGYLVNNYSFNYELLLFLLEKYPRKPSVPLVDRVLNRPKNFQFTDDIPYDKNKDMEDDSKTKPQYIEETKEYLYGLEWVLKTLEKGEYLCQNWYYPYNVSPGYSDIYQFIRENKKIEKKDCNTSPLQPYEYCIYVIHKDHINDVAEHLRDIIKKCDVFETNYQTYLDMDARSKLLADVKEENFKKDEKEYSLIGPVLRISFTITKDKTVLPPVAKWERKQFPVRVIKIYGEEISCYSEFGYKVEDSENKVVFDPSSFYYMYD